MSNKLQRDKTSHAFRKYLRKWSMRLDPAAHREAHGCFGCYLGILDIDGDVKLGEHGERDNRASRRWMKR